MPHLAPHDIMHIFIALAVLLGAAKLAGELMQKLDQPSVLGEIMAGILLGPTLLGHFRPDLYAFIFPATGNVPIALETVTTLGVVFFLLIAGLEIDLRSIFRQGKSALLVSFFGVIIPFAFGFGAAGLFPRFLGAAPGADRLIFALFVGTALSISALPVIAKILMDLNLLRSEMGTVVMSSAMFDDLVGWILFSMILGMMNGGGTSWGVGLAMNARGAMEMILGLLALQLGLIRETMFVALVIMALFTSLVSAPAIKFLIGRRRTITLKDTVNAKLFFPALKSQTKQQVLQEMCVAAADAVGNSPERFLRLVQERERVTTSGWENGLAVPHARVNGLLEPLVVVGRVAQGIDFDARDGKLARLIILILTGDNQSQHDLLLAAGELFSRKEAVEQALHAETFVELMAALNAPVH